MQTEYLIAVDEFCASHNIDSSFISNLNKTGLLEVRLIKENEYIDPEQLLHLEKIVRFYYDLDINLEGIETINFLLKRIGNLQDEIVLLKNRLSLYEAEL